MQTRLLLTGGAGFIGQNLVHLLARHDNTTRIVVMDALTYAANPTSLEPLIASGRVEFVRGDIANLDTVRDTFERFGIDAVAHLAAESHVDRSISGPDAFVQTNVIGTYNLLKCAVAEWRKRGILDKSRFLHVSTDEVFGDLGPDDPAFSESSAYRPSSPYSATKASSDHLVRAFGRTYGLQTIVTNCSNNYGPYQHPEKLIPLMIVRALEGKSMPIYGDGANVRDWLFVEDHARALALALRAGAPGETYNIGGGAELTNMMVVRQICARIDDEIKANPVLSARYPACPASNGGSCDSLITFVTDRPGHDRRYAVNPSFARVALGYAPQETFVTGLTRTVRWYLENEAWWRRAMSADFSQWLAENYLQRPEAAK